MMDDGVPVRILGIRSRNGRLLTATEAAQRQPKSDTELTVIGAHQVKDHMMVLYLMPQGSCHVAAVIAAMEKNYGFKLERRVDKSGREFWWRIVPSTVRKPGEHRGSRKHTSSRDLWRSRYPEVDLLDDADHWCNLADLLGVDPGTLAGNLD